MGLGFQNFVPPSRVQGLGTTGSGIEEKEDMRPLHLARGEPNSRLPLGFTCTVKIGADHFLYITLLLYIIFLEWNSVVMLPLISCLKPLPGQKGLSWTLSPERRAETFLTQETKVGCLC